MLRKLLPEPMKSLPSERNGVRARPDGRWSAGSRPLSSGILMTGKSASGKATLIMVMTMPRRAEGFQSSLRASENPALAYPV